MAQTEEHTDQSIPKPIHESKAVQSSSWVSLSIGLILLFISVVGIALGIVFIPTKAAGVSKLRSQLLTSAMSSQDMALLKQSVEATTPDREKLQNAFPTEASLLEFITLIDNLKNDEVMVTQFSVDSDVPTKIGKNPPFLPMTLVLKGSKRGVEEALLKLSKSIYFVRPVAMTYSLDQSGAVIEVRSSFHLFVSEPYAKPKS